MDTGSSSRPARRVGILAIATALALAACTGAAPTQAPAAGGSPTGSQPAGSRDVGETQQASVITDFLLWGWHSPFFAGADEGFFADEGIDLTIRDGKGSVDTATQLASGNVDFGLIDISTALKAMSEGADFKLIGVHLQRYPGGFLYIEERTPVTSWSDFEDIKIGGTPADAYLTALPGLMRENGADPDAVDLVEMEAAATTGALIAGQVDAIPGSAMTAPPRRAAAAEEDLTLGRFGFADNGFDGVGFAIATTTEHYENDKELVQSFVDAWAKSTLWSLQNRDAAVEAFVAANPEKSFDLERQSFEESAALIPYDESSYFVFDEDRMTFTIDFVNETYGVNFDGSEAFTNEFVEQLPDGYLEGSLED